MAYGSMNKDKGMDSDSLYGDDDKMGKEQPDSIDEEAQEEMNDKALVPMKVLQASPDDKVKVGDERVVKVMAIHGDQAEIIYAPKKEGNDEMDHKGMDHGDTGSADDELDSMSKGSSY